jgi:hypothetical protein
MPETGGSPTLTVKALLQQPTLLSRELVNLVNKRLIADRSSCAARPTRSPAARSATSSSSRSSSTTTRTRSPRAPTSRSPTGRRSSRATSSASTGSVSASRTSRSAATSATWSLRGQVKLANRIVKFIDTKAMAVLEDAGATAGVQTQAASALWTTHGTDIIADLGPRRRRSRPRTTATTASRVRRSSCTRRCATALLNNTALRAALPREASDGQIRTGMMAPFLGLKEILFTPQITSTKAILLDTSIAGTIADERPDRPRSGSPTIRAPASHRSTSRSRTSAARRAQGVFAGRWPAIVLPEPKAVVVITGSRNG